MLLSLPKVIIVVLYMKDPMTMVHSVAMQIAEKIRTVTSLPEGMLITTGDMAGEVMAGEVTTIVVAEVLMIMVEVILTTTGDAVVVQPETLMIVVEVILITIGDVAVVVEATAIAAEVVEAITIVVVVVTMIEETNVREEAVVVSMTNPG